MFTDKKYMISLKKFISKTKIPKQKIYLLKKTTTNTWSCRLCSPAQASAS
jgi:hypothetical protein